MRALPLALLASLPAAAQTADGVVTDAQVPVVEPTEPASPTPPEHQVWAGVLSVLGSRKIPLLGKVEFQTDTYVLARATRTDTGGWSVVQSTCKVQFPRTMGAEITIDPDSFAKIPTSRLEWRIDPEGAWSAGPWPSGWNDDDHDGDGLPGITLHVAAPFCGGDLYVSSQASQSASGRPTTERVVAGDVQIYVEQKTLGTRGPCLGLMARDSAEWMDGQFAFVRARDGATCETVETWPTVKW